MKSTPTDPFGVELRDLEVRYAGDVALKGITLMLEPGRIYGLLGRNGSGKTTLLSTIAGLRRPARGTVRVDGEDPFDHSRLMRRTALLGIGVPGLAGLAGERVREALRLPARLRPTWDDELAETLLRRFDLPAAKRVQTLSAGQRAALGLVIGLAGRAPLTMFDEAHLGLDAPSRYAFYDLLLADYAEHPRTVILATHHIDEVAKLFESVLILDHGGVMLYEDADALRAQGVTVTGPAGAVDDALRGLTPLREQRLAGTKVAVVYGPQVGDLRTRSRTAGLDVGPVGLQDLVVHLTTGERRP